MLYVCRLYWEMRLFQNIPSHFGFGLFSSFGFCSFTILNSSAFQYLCVTTLCIMMCLTEQKISYFLSYGQHTLQRKAQKTLSGIVLDGDVLALDHSVSLEPFPTELLGRLLSAHWSTRRWCGRRCWCPLSRNWSSRNWWRASVVAPWGPGRPPKAPHIDASYWWSRQPSPYDELQRWRWPLIHSMTKTWTAIQNQVPFRNAWSIFNPTMLMAGRCEALALNENNKRKKITWFAENANKADMPPTLTPCISTRKRSNLKKLFMFVLRMSSRIESCENVGGQKIVGPDLNFGKLNCYKKSFLSL